MKLFHIIQGISLLIAVLLIWIGDLIFSISETTSLGIASLIIVINAGLEIFL